MRWKKVTLVGVGLLGGSLGLALRQHGLAGQVCGYVRRAASLQECLSAGAVDVATLDLAEAVAGADLVVLCTPIAQMRPLVKQMLCSLKPGVVVTDVGSVKEPVVRGLESLLARKAARFVGSHPMAGSEKTGVTHARADLFVHAVCVITPTPKTNRAALTKIERLWKEVGARVLRATPKAHDKWVSLSSHLPHVAAAALANLILEPAAPKQQAALCANGFRDTTRIASGSPEMWRDITIANHQNLAAALRAYTRELARVERGLRRGDARALETFFARAKARRDQWIQWGGSASSE